MESWIHAFYPPVQIPVLAHIRETRGDIAEDVDTLFSQGITKTNGEKYQVENPWIVAGPTTQHFAKQILRYSERFRDHFAKIDVLHRNLREPGFKQGYWDKIAELVTHVKQRGFDFIMYVGSQNIADTAKAVAAECKILTGGVITAISSDGLFSDTAALLDDQELSKSKPTVAPYFVLAHRPTLVRSPSNMKAACVADILTNHSSLWDYEYSCTHLNLPPSDIAMHFARMAADLIDLDDISELALVNHEAIENLFRATELCGLSMQLNRGFDGRPTSATCSGSEHLIEKEIRKFMVKRNRELKKAGKPPKRVHLHGEILSPCLLLTLVLQGKSELMVRIRDAFTRLNLPTKVTELNIEDHEFLTCVLNARGVRAHAFMALEAGKDPKTDRRLDRITVLENIEQETLRFAVKDAMRLAKIGFSGG